MIFCKGASSLCVDNELKVLNDKRNEENFLMDRHQYPLCKIRFFFISYRILYSNREGFYDKIAIEIVR